MHSTTLGQDCDEACGVEWGTIPSDIHELPLRFRTEVPIEGVGVVHVTSEPTGCRFDSWSSDVILWRYSGQTVTDRVTLTSCGGSAASAREMHTYWCDPETVALCVLRVPSALGIIDEYFDRKHTELFGPPTGE